MSHIISKNQWYIHKYNVIKYCYILFYNLFLVKLRYNKFTEKPIEENTEMLALNAEAETFIKHLVYIADEKNLETIMGQIVKMDLDNKSMFRFLMEIESYVSNIF